jgi:DNA-binding transcriptional LysR family regulator
MDRAAEMTAFVRTVETGGFSAAARQLGLTPSALSKLVTRLEDRLGARLLQRTTRRLQLTAEGEAFYARALPILKAMDEAEAEVTEAGTSPRGLLRLHCGSTFGMHQLAPAIPRFQARHPSVSLDITISDERLDMMQEGCRPGNPHRAARRVVAGGAAHLQPGAGDLRRAVLPRTPRHAAHAGRPAAAQLPVDHQPAGPAPLALRYRRRHPRGTCRWQRGTNNAETVLQLAVAGVGVTRLSDVVVADAIRAARWCPSSPTGTTSSRCRCCDLPERPQPVAQGACHGRFPGRGIRRRPLAQGTR